VPEIIALRPFEYSDDGLTTKNYEKGRQTVSDNCAEFALGEGLAVDKEARGPWVLPEWERCVIVAAGPSAPESLEGWTGARGWPVIVINESWRLVAEASADMLYACDLKWWQENNGAPFFKGLKVTIDEKAVKLWPDLTRVWSRDQSDFVFGRPGETSGGGNSGHQALNLAVSLGCKEIALVGFDFSLERGVHWHGAHTPPLWNPNPDTFKRWIDCMNRAAPRLSAHGVKVWNCSSHSALTCFEKATLCNIAQVSH